MKTLKQFSTRIFGGETAEIRTFTVDDIFDFNHLTERLFLEAIRIEVPRLNPRVPLNDDQRKILDGYVVIEDKDGCLRSEIETWVDINAFDLGKFSLGFFEKPLHLFPGATITVDVPAKADFFFKILCFIAPL